MFRRGSFLMLVVVLVAGCCANLQVLRAPVSDCALDCKDPRASPGEQIMCLRTCPGAELSERPCDPDEKADTVCVSETPDEVERRDDPNGIGELVGILLGVGAAIGLTVLAATSD